MSTPTPCAGCGAKTSRERCIGCRHIFGDELAMTPTPTHTAVQRFRKKPVVIEAYQWLPDAPMDASVPLWYDEGCASGALYPEFDKTLSINTLEGTMRADPGDWIIRGVKGELYPCKPDIFAATYEPVSLPAPQGEQPTVEEVLGAMSRRDQARTSAENVQDVLRALAALGASQDSRTPTVAPGGQPLPQADENDLFPLHECLRLADLWTSGVDLNNEGQWRIVMKVLLDQLRAQGDSALPPVEPPGATLSPCANQPVERCKCGYPMPCAMTVPIGFCRAQVGESSSEGGES